ncbi:hypothetical protein [Leptolyngbya sp. NIES-2104]|uniref:hypothetical protein n=1 Tax=Leptolyngbya sp. NIES-2104 TaxID=1552121 RepID=UPI0006EC51A7|nr:hypothetical protein [Leptolyngbya sp. NIES-2104]GAP97507.1 hypothetical protein NIES2104_40540 [Leptolyngbya sp. NIES-2104]
MKTAVVFVSLFLYAISLANPVFYFIRSESSGYTSPEVQHGISVLLTAWLGIFFSQFGWFANPPYFLSLLFVWMQHQRIAIAFSALALVVGITNTIWLFHQTLPADEALINKMKLQHLGSGYYFWITALIIPFVWSTVRSFYSKPR